VIINGKLRFIMAAHPFSMLIKRGDWTISTHSTTTAFT
jgi:hypothetical protein